MHSLALVLASLAVALAHPHALHDHPEERGSLLSSLGISDWAQPAGHPTHGLFRRQAKGGTHTPSPVSRSLNLTASVLVGYPDFIPDATQMPQAWKDALAAATSAGLVPNIVQTKDGVYPAGTNPADPTICASAYECRGEGDIWDAPDGMLGVSFDDVSFISLPRLARVLIMGLA